MNTPNNPHEFDDPLLERSPEPFPEPRTIPTGWDLSEYLAAPARPQQTAADEQPTGDPYLA